MLDSLVFSLLLLINLFDAANITISTQLGAIRGTWENNFFVFHGIPFTEFPPVGNNRFVQTTVRNSSYTQDDSVYDATHFRPACIQHDATNPDIEMDEDCLYLNIFTPNINTTTQLSLPVLVWIYGGSWQTGSASNVLYNGKGFMNQNNGRDVVYVSINYRLGGLGYLSLQSILAETNGVSTGGLNGIIDQIVALQWIQNNIVDFGGDPAQVTVFGESAGGISICMLLATTSELVRSQNLFTQAILQSAPCFGFPAQYEQGLESSAQLLQYANLTDDLNELRELDAVRFLTIPAAPSADGYLLHSPINITTATTVELNADKLVIGFTSMDSLYTFPWFAAGELDEAPKNERDLQQYLNVYFNDDDTLTDMIKERYYPISDFKEAEYFGDLITNYSMLWYTMNADVCFICPSIGYAQTLQFGVNSDIANNNMFLYYFMGIDPYYIPHAGELAFLFNNSESAAFFGIEWNELLSRFMIETWVNFGVYGIPNSTLYPQEWHSFGINQTVMTFMDENGNIDKDFVTNYRNGVCNFWMNDVEVDIMTNVCGQRLSVVQTGKRDKLETWVVVVISIGVSLVAILLCVALKYKCCKQSEAETLQTQLVSKKEYGTPNDNAGRL